MRANRFQAAVSLFVASTLTGCVVSQTDVNSAYDSATRDATHAMAGMGESMRRLVSAGMWSISRAWKPDFMRPTN
jgi:hypothetical protein